MLLAIDTATNVPSIALYDAQGVLGEMTWRTYEHHTRSLMPEITRLTELLNLDARLVQAIAVANGPGSFTGLRIGLSAAKGLAYSLNAALLGVPTLDITANACAQQPLPICAVILAGRGRYAAAMYRVEREVAVRAGDYWFGTAESIAAHAAATMSEPFLLVGETDAALRAEMQLQCGARVVLAHQASNLRRAGFLAELAWRRWQAGEVDDLQTLAPFYIPTAALA
jgi:tRNA threonylcarbamoyladenosine biosynthesis protein TsaB